jgi:hypothetical protein
MARYFLPSVREVVPFRTGAEWVRLSGDARTIMVFRTRMRGIIDPSDIPADWPFHRQKIGSKDEWERWQRELRRLVPRLLERQHASVEMKVTDLIAAAMDRPPGSLFRVDLRDMTQVDWTHAALAAMPRGTEEPEAPHWLLIVALAALGFGRRLLYGLAQEPPPWRPKIDAADMSFVRSLVADVQLAEPATLSIYRGLPGAANLEIHPGEPVLSVGRTEYEDYMDGLEWLAGQGAFREVTYE